MGIKCVCDTFLQATAGSISAKFFSFMFHSAGVVTVALLTFSQTGTSFDAIAAAAALSFSSSSSTSDVSAVTTALFLLFVTRSAGRLCFTAFTAECNGMENSASRICFSFHFVFLCDFRFRRFSWSHFSRFLFWWCVSATKIKFSAKNEYTAVVVTVTVNGDENKPLIRWTNIPLFKYSKLRLNRNGLLFFQILSICR